jgi:hypothetical protein
MKHRKVAKSENQYLRGIIHNYSLQRWTDQEIADYLRVEKKIDIARSTVSKIKNQIEKQAEKWYIELQLSRYKYIATYKERLDSLLLYQRKLNQIIEFYMDPPNHVLYSDTLIRAISELHRIEISIFNIWKQLPTLDPSDTKNSIPNAMPIIKSKINGSEFYICNIEKCIQCHSCKRWFKNEGIISVHECDYDFIRESIK